MSSLAKMVPDLTTERTDILSVILAAPDNLMFKGTVTDFLEKLHSIICFDFAIISKQSNSYFQNLES